MPRLYRPAPLEWLYLGLGSYLVLHYAWLMDDAFVYFRYADNLLLLKFGLVYNRGEYVEGFSSPLWQLLLLPPRALGLSWWWIVRLFALLSFAGFWLALVQLNRRMSPPDSPVVNLPLALLTFNYAVATSFSGGLETPLVTLCAPFFALALAGSRRRAVMMVLALSPIVRHELLVPLVLTVAWMWWRDRKAPRFLMLASGAALSTWMAFRIVYYAALLPNTYYLKDGSWYGQGLLYAWNGVGPYLLHLDLVLLALLAWWLWRTRRPGDGFDPKLAERGAMLAVALASTFYVVRIGGDFLHYRYLAFAVPLAVCASAGLAEAALVRWMPRRGAIGAVAVGLIVAVVTFFLVPPQLSSHPYRGGGDLSVIHEIEDAFHHRRRPELKRDPWQLGNADPWREKMLRWRQENPRPRFAMLAGDYWCVRIYENFDYYDVHALGLTDPFLARIDIPLDRPGHKWRLQGLAGQLVGLRGHYGHGTGIMARAVREGLAPDWIEANLPAIEVLERRIHNRHRPFENLKLALTPVGRIHLVSPPPPLKTHREPRMNQRGGS